MLQKCIANGILDLQVKLMLSTRAYNIAYFQYTYGLFVARVFRFKQHKHIHIVKRLLVFHIPLAGMQPGDQVPQREFPRPYLD